MVQSSTLGADAFAIRHPVRSSLHLLIRLKADGLMLAQQPVRGYLSCGEYQVWEVVIEPISKVFPRGFRSKSGKTSNEALAPDKGKTYLRLFK
jgi:hypothetical protein